MTFQIRETRGKGCAHCHFCTSNLVIRRRAVSGMHICHFLRVFSPYINSFLFLSKYHGCRPGRSVHWQQAWDVTPVSKATQNAFVLSLHSPFVSLSCSFTCSSFTFPLTLPLPFFFHFLFSLLLAFFPHTLHLSLLPCAHTLPLPSPGKKFIKFRN